MNIPSAIPKNLGSFIWHFLRTYKMAMVIFIVLALITGIWAPINNLLIKYMIDALDSRRATGTAVMPFATYFSTTSSYIFWLAVFFALNFEIHNLCWRGMGFLNYKFQPVIKNRIITESLGYILRSSHQFIQNNLAGRLANQINTLADNIERIVHDLSRHIIRGLILLIATFLSMYLVHPKFFYAIAIWFIIFVTISIELSKRLIKLSENHADSESVISGQLVDSITNTSNVRIFARRDDEVSYLNKALTLTKKAFQAKEGFSLKLHVFQGSSLTAMLGVMLYFLIQLYKSQQVSIGDFALILGLSVEVGYMAWWTLEQIDELNKSTGKCKQSLANLFVPLEITDKDNAAELIVEKGEIVFSNVKFNYKNTALLFEDKSVIIKAGQKVGLVGYSGSGKSTFVNLILRLYDVTDGKILIDDQDIRDITQDSLRTHIAMIPQDPSLFHRTLMENIRYGKMDATEEEVIEAAKRAHAHEFICKLPSGYQSLVGERGIKLSGGQRQRIAIARAILKNAPILILDEATSQLDSVTEKAIQESLWNLMQNKTTIVIAHRLSTLLHMDRILVFNHGKIIEDGKHSELLSLNGLYKTLWDTQVGGLLPHKRMSVS